MVSGPQYSADYKIGYLDSSQVELDGTWTYGVDGEKNYRTKRVYHIHHFQLLSYYTFLWTDFLKDTEKEEEVLFRRIKIPKIEILPDTALVVPEISQESP